MLYKIGKQANFSKTISESDVYLFAGITGDLNPVHVNAEEAKNAIFGERIVHGILVAGLISNVIAMQLPGPGTIYMSQELKFLAPVKIGDTVTAVVTLQKVINEEKRILELNTDVLKQDGTVVITGKAIVKAPKIQEEE
jgi:3-hydroxybutyryl-CoA dehydratase